MTGVSVYWREFPADLIEHHVLHGRKVVRHEGAEPEMQFFYRAVPRLIPAWHDGELKVFIWGSTDRQSTLPVSGWARTEDVEAGQWTRWNPELVVIPAFLCLD